MRTIITQGVAEVSCDVSELVQALQQLPEEMTQSPAAGVFIEDSGGRRYHLAELETVETKDGSDVVVLRAGTIA